ncbi:TlpA family protein disulfide reductase [Zhihengliuella flava]|uniref:Thiol-disulfide isomerase/thioredoxin n=1 Tax=Zhihengliuella flava TaxID=1285193 RepID=A0A931GF05_9MICC|nr:TlpA disulfide reductase family protein [Zhihengliuella flava]MBG6084137.1 thiol-disulfide isomerase/thioredoxin [Zhihengliuella flava]
MKSTPLSRRRLLASAAALAVVAPVAACSPAEDPLTSSVSNQNYVAGDGSVEIYAESDRGEPLEVQGTFYNGDALDSADWAGQVTILNFWYAACAPCRVEAPHLVTLAHDFEDQNVEFVGVNVRDTEPTAAAFERTFEIPYPSAPDTDGSILLGVSQFVNPQAVPTTLVLDAQGRVAARILGVVEEATLRGLIEDRLGEAA